MPNPGYDPADLAEAVRLVQLHGTVTEASNASGIPRSTLDKRYRTATRDPAMEAAKQAVGTGLEPALAWIKTKPTDDLPGYSVLLKPAKEADSNFREELRDIILSTTAQLPPSLPRRFDAREGLLAVVDPADVHIGKLSVLSETGRHYDSDVAEHRLVEGCRSLCEQAMANGASQVLFVIGNDISHIDTPKRTTTSGTPQDTHGSIHSIFRAAVRGYNRAVQNALAMGLPVQIIYVPSNHDWVLGFTIAQTLAAIYGQHTNVIVSDYAISERHRKYVRFGRNLMGFSHGDGAKESDLPQIMQREARKHAAECDHLYWYLHHFHHKIKKALGIRPQAREKDHIAMTVMRSGIGAMEGDNVQVEYVRSPSDPDGWHDRNGYIGRQAVEAFLHHPQDGQTNRFTVWF
jgi:hypothetical protein